MFQKSYTNQELENILKNTAPRKGWDFSKMNTQRQQVPWQYLDIVALYLKTDDIVLDIGTGGGENFIKLSKLFQKGVGIDLDPEMVKVSQGNAKNINNISFHQDSKKLENTTDKFDVILNRHAAYDLNAISDHLNPNAYFITQQVGEDNMQNIKKTINKMRTEPVITREEVKNSRLRLIAFMEYNVEYVVSDVESLVFWLQALDSFHADLPGGEALKNSDIFNKILDGNVGERGFITNEQRFLVIAQK